MRTPDVAVVGAGVIGLATAWRLSRRGATVRVYDPAPGSGASTVAAGMLGPAGEAHFGEEHLTGTHAAAAAAWPGFAAELEAAAGTPVGLRTDGTLLVGYDADDARELDRTAELHRTLGIPARRLPGSACRRLEPLLSPRVRAGLLAEGDHQVDPRRVHAALLAALAAAGVPVEPAEVTSLAEVPAGTVVLAAGCRSGRLAPDLPVRPVKGQLLRLRATPGAPRFDRVVRAVVAGRPVYLVPRHDGEVVVGATTEELGFDTTVTAGGVYDLLRAAIRVLPVVAEYELAETCAGLRPGTPDNAPLLGRTADPRVVAATGHHRNGILLTPFTADALAELVETGDTPPALAPFSPLRFAKEPS